MVSIELLVENFRFILLLQLTELLAKYLYYIRVVCTQVTIYPAYNYGEGVCVVWSP